MGIGLATAEVLHDLGAEVIISARGEDTLRRLADERSWAYAVADLASAADIDRLLADVGDVDILVSNAGGPPTGLPSAVTDEAWQRGFELTFMSSVRLARGVLPSMRARGWGRVVAITSLTVNRPLLGLPVSNALRAGVTNFYRSLALEVARDGITVNTVAPGYTATQRLAEVFKSPEDEARTIAEIPAARLGTPREVAAAVGFLASNEAAYVTGQELLVDGGWGI